MKKPTYWRIVDDIASKEWGQHTLYEACEALARAILDSQGKITKLDVKLNTPVRKKGLF